MSKVCANCGTELEDSALFCDECGAKIEMTKPLQNDTKQKEVNVGQMTSSVYQPTTIDSISTTKMKNSGMGIASFIMGLVSICTLGVFIIPEILGLIFGIIAIQDKTKKQGLPIAGLVLSILTILLVFLLLL